MEKLEYHLQVFDGPLDLLLALIAKNKLDIYDIPISELLDQYLEQIALMREADMDVASEFLEMAARLVQIKAASLLPQHEQDEEDPKSQNDFGKNVLPAMLNAGEAMYAYRFEGYWKDVGTIDSLWESNMDLLDPNVPLELNDPEWRIYSRNPVMPPHYVAKGATIQNSLAAEGCNVYGTVDFSVLFAGVYVAPGATVRDSIIMPGARIEEGATVQYAIVAEDSVVGANSVVGQRPEDVENKEDWGVAVIGPGCKLAPGTVVPPKAMIDAEEVEK